MKEILIEILALCGGIVGGTLAAIIPLTIALGIPLLIIYAIYRAIKGLMTHDAELKARERDKHGRDL